MAWRLKVSDYFVVDKKIKKIKTPTWKVDLTITAMRSIILYEFLPTVSR